MGIKTFVSSLGSEKNKIADTRMPVDNPEKKKISLKDFESYKHFSYLFNGLVQKRAKSAIEMAFHASSCETCDILVEIGPSQYFLLMLLYAFSEEDMTFTYFLLELVKIIQPRQTSYLKIWLANDFTFKPEKIYKAICFLYYKKDLLDIPSHILETMLHLKDKYNVQEQCRANGNVDVLSWMEDFQ